MPRSYLKKIIGIIEKWEFLIKMLKDEVVKWKKNLDIIEEQWKKTLLNSNSSKRKIEEEIEEEFNIFSEWAREESTEKEQP